MTDFTTVQPRIEAGFCRLLFSCAAQEMKTTQAFTPSDGA